MDHHLLAIRVFNRVVETGGFTRAADSLRMPKTTVTKLIQNLENHLKIKLFQRTTRSVSVTKEGECYYRRTVKWLADLEQMEGSMTESQSEPQGVLRVDAAGSLSRQLLIPALPEFLERYPEISIDLGVSDRLVDLINDNADCVIRSGPLVDSTLIARRLFTMDLVTCATPDYFKRYGTPTHPEELEQGYPLGYYRHARNDRIYPLRFIDRGKIIEVQQRYQISVNESNAHLAVALSGAALSQVVRFAAQPYLDSGELIGVLDDYQPPPEQIYLVYPSNRHLSARLRVFIEWAVARFT